jgi:2-polyprenyl-3-methyl-5-hydroxy-6-metoxy-1,4-benzoquinol methylase
VLTFLTNKERKWADKYMNETRHRDCPICSYSFGKLFQTFLVKNTLYSCDICERCGFVFQNPIYNKEHYHSLPCSYPKNYWSHSFKRAKYIYDFCSDYLQLMDKVNILDIGAGRGGVLMNLNVMILNSGHSTGITLEDERPYRTLHKFDFEDDTLVNEFIKQNEHKFNFIVMSHILEHFIDPLKAILNVRKLLAPDGIIYIEVPSLYFAEYRISSVWTPEHLSFFNTKTLSRLMFQNNFNLVKMVDSKIWGNIKSVWKYDNGLETFEWSNDSDVRKKYEENRFAKFIQRAKHKLGFKYEANI